MATVNLVVKKVLETSLPSSGTDGEIYLTDKQNCYVVNKSGALIKNTDIIVVNSLPTTNIIPNKLYILTTNYSINIYDGTAWHTPSSESGESSNASDITVTDSSNHFTSSPKNVENILAELFTLSNSSKSLLENAVGDTSLTTSNTFGEISNKILSDKQAIVTALSTKGVTATQSDNLGSYATKISGIVQNSKLSNTKLNQTANSTHSIELTDSTTIEEICTSILEYVPGTQGVVQYDCSFNNSDSSSFNTVPHVVFDGDMYEELNVTDTQMTQTTDNSTNITNGKEYEVLVDKSVFCNYTVDIAEEHDDTSGNPFIKLTGIYNPILVQANSDISLVGVDAIASIVWTAICQNASKLLLLYSIDSGVTWHGYNKSTSTVTSIDISNNSDIEAKGISISDINSLITMDLANMRNSSSKIRFAYYFDMNNANDVVKNSELKLTVNMTGTNIPSTHCAWSFDGNKTITYTFTTAGTYTINYLDNN